MYWCTIIFFITISNPRIIRADCICQMATTVYCDQNDNIIDILYLPCHSRISKLVTESMFTCDINILELVPKLKQIEVMSEDICHCICEMKLINVEILNCKCNHFKTEIKPYNFESKFYTEMSMAPDNDLYSSSEQKFDVFFSIIGILTAAILALSGFAFRKYVFKLANRIRSGRSNGVCENDIPLAPLNPQPQPPIPVNPQVHPQPPEPPRLLIRLPPQQPRRYLIRNAINNNILVHLTIAQLRRLAVANHIRLLRTYTMIQIRNLILDFVMRIFNN